MVITADSITLSFLVVAAVTLAVVSVLVWYVYSSKKFRENIISLMDKKLEDYLVAKQSPSYSKQQPMEEVETQEETPEEQKEVADELPNAETKHE